MFLANIQCRSGRTRSPGGHERPSRAGQTILEQRGIIESGRTGRELRLVGVSTRSPDGRAWMADRYPDIRVYDDYAAMLADPEIAGRRMADTMRLFGLEG